MEDKRNYEDLWKEPFIVGAHWDQIPIINQHNWDFTNLEYAFEEWGVLHDKRVFLFACIEVPESYVIPVIVALVSPFPPSNQIESSAVRLENKEIVPMKWMNMDWVPYVPLVSRGNKVKNMNSEIFVLKCYPCRSAYRNMKQDRLRNCEYNLPYSYNLFEEEDEEDDPDDTTMYDMDLNPLFCHLDGVVEGQIDVPPNQKKEFVRERVREAKKAAREAHKKVLEVMNEETKGALQDVRFYKFYPARTPHGLIVQKSNFVSRYFGKTHKIY